MSVSSFARRKAKKIALSGDGDDARGEDEPVSFVKRPAPKTKRGSSVKVSFGGASSMIEDDSATEVFKPKKSGLARQALEKSAQRRSGLAETLREDDYATRIDSTLPSYSKEYLAELKSSTPTTPKSEQGGLPTSGEVDVASRFDSGLAKYAGIGSSLIPTDAEIQEKKSRRARLAKEMKYGGDSDSNSGDDRGGGDEHDSDEDEFRTQHDKISLRDSRSAKPSKYEETRLVRDDEDFMEDFDDFVNTGQIAMGRRAAQVEKKRQREQIKEMIANAEGASDSAESSDSEAEARRQYDAAQTRRGMEGMKLAGEQQDEAKPPDKITPLVSLSACKEKLRANLQHYETERAAKVKQLELVQQDRREIDVQEEDIQRLLDETADRYRQLVADGVLIDGSVDTKLLTTGMHGSAQDGGASLSAANGHAEAMDADE